MASRCPKIGMNLCIFTTFGRQKWVISRTRQDMRGRWETTGNVVTSQSKHRIYTTPAGSCDEKGILDGFRGFAPFIGVLRDMWRSANIRDIFQSKFYFETANSYNYIYAYIHTSTKTWEVYRPAEVNQEHWVLLSFRSTLLIDNGLFTLFSFDSCWPTG